MRLYLLALAYRYACNVGVEEVVLEELEGLEVRAGGHLEEEGLMTISAVATALILLLTRYITQHQLLARQPYHILCTPLYTPM